MILHMQVARLIKLFVPIIYCFCGWFVILVYVAIVIPMMNVIPLLFIGYEDMKRNNGYID